MYLSSSVAGVTSVLEVHLTVEGCGPSALREILDELATDAKVTHIALGETGNDDTSDQLMVTWHQPGPLASAEVRSAELGDQLERRHVRAVRLKVEVTADDLGHGHGQYLEHHVLISLPIEDVDRLRNAAGVHDGRVSMRARRRAATHEQRFVTQRWWQPDRLAEATTTFDAMVDDLAANNFNVEQRITERVIHDSNLELDAGWLDRPTPSMEAPA